MDDTGPCGLLRLPNELVSIVIGELSPIDVASLVQSSTFFAAYRSIPLQRDIHDRRYDSLCFACLSDDQYLLARIVALGGVIDVVFCRSTPPSPRLVDDAEYFASMAVYPRSSLHSGAPCSPIAKAAMEDSVVVLQHLLALEANTRPAGLSPAIPRATAAEAVLHVPHPCILVHARSRTAFHHLASAGAAQNINDVGVNGFGAIEMVLYSMDEQANQNHVPLDEAVAYQRVERLIHRGAVLRTGGFRLIPNNGRSGTPSGPLMAAVAVRSTRVARLILERGGYDIKASDPDLHQIAKFIRGSARLPGRSRSDQSNSAFRVNLLTLIEDTLQPSAGWLRQQTTEMVMRDSSL